MQVHSVVLLVVGTVCKLDYSFVTKDNPNKMATSRKKLCCDKESSFYSVCFSLDLFR